MNCAQCCRTYRRGQDLVTARSREGVNADTKEQNAGKCREEAEGSRAQGRDSLL